MQNMSPGDSSNPCTPVLEGLAGHAQSFQVDTRAPACRLQQCLIFDNHTAQSHTSISQSGTDWQDCCMPMLYHHSALAALRLSEERS